MDKLNFVQNGARKLPPGFRFQPTDEEIVFQYLTRKTFSFPLPASVVPEISVCNYDPWDLPGDGEEDRYFFTRKEAKYQNGTRANRATSSGYWKATGSDKRITCPKRSKDTMGLRKTLVFHTGKPPGGSRTDWIMHEYRLVNSGTTSCNNSTKNNDLVQMGNWFLCRVFLKNGSTEKQDEEEISQPRANDFMNRRELNDDGGGPSSSSSSSCGSSVITEATANGLDHEETSGPGFHCFSPYLYR
ncbi:hypothetical protein RHGRI_024640 [Rhododendron griersonianum]|uniref:NAC domain-containing protein n=1 Tax=Rhododendron griersonianum TaxID=479676 RepID=A0AAV6JCF9_9ERIC|nr:hypothetical protein RHGRI_024640 [Rhododendron griersonianum]